jgi:hypothetical protein
MSTASRYCEAARGARAGGLNAASVPGDSGKTRRHYDWRTIRYRDGGPGNRDMRSKREPEAEIAAPTSRAPMPVEYSGLRGARLRHSPPPFCSHARPPPAIAIIRRASHTAMLAEAASAD